MLTEQKTVFCPARTQGLFMGPGAEAGGWLRSLPGCLVGPSLTRGLSQFRVISLQPGQWFTPAVTEASTQGAKDRPALPLHVGAKLYSPDDVAISRALVIFSVEEVYLSAVKMLLREERAAGTWEGWDQVSPLAFQCETGGLRTIALALFPTVSILLTALWPWLSC